MKTYLKPNTNSFGINRVSKSLSDNLSSGFEIVDSPEDAELIVIHVTGRNEHTTKYAKELLQQGKQYVVIQYVLQSSRNPNPKDWVELWNGAKFVWSYYDLKKHISNFYHAPLGVNTQTFYRMSAEKKYTVGSMGNYYRDEAIGEVQLALWQMGGNGVHIGENFNRNPIIFYTENVSDDDLRILYNQCKYFSALRRKDGFEIPIAEALLCGVRPVVFDTPNYRQWYDGLVEFIPEASVSETVGNLKHLFKRDPRPVTEEEIEEVKKRFNWKIITKGFWENVSN